MRAMRGFLVGVESLGGRSRVAALFISKGVVIIFCASWVWGECGYSWLYVIVHK